MGKNEKKMVAVRNIDLCSKDCLCLYVCPNGATDTENSIIDVDKCTGCGMCANACPSKAISMVPVEYPAQQKKKKEVVKETIPQVSMGERNALKNYNNYNKITIVIIYK